MQPWRFQHLSSRWPVHVAGANTCHCGSTSTHLMTLAVELRRYDRCRSSAHNHKTQNAMGISGISIRAHYLSFWTHSEWVGHSISERYSIFETERYSISKGINLRTRTKSTQNKITNYFFFSNFGKCSLIPVVWPFRTSQGHGMIYLRTRIGARFGNICQCTNTLPSMYKNTHFCICLNIK